MCVPRGGSVERAGPNVSPWAEANKRWRKKQSHCSNDAPDYYNKTLTEGSLERPLWKTVWRAPHTRNRAAMGPGNPAPEHTPR